jgi:polo-like kinase 1
VLCHLTSILPPNSFRYTLLIGKPPFQTKDVKAIYKRIRENRYEFPVDKVISSSAQDLIMSILNTDPGKIPLDTLLSDSRLDDTS